MLFSIILFILPTPIKLRNFVTQLGLHLGFIALLLSPLVLIGDTLYFGFVSRHLYHDLGLLKTELPFLIPLIMDGYKTITFSYLLATSLAVWLWIRHWKTIVIIFARPSSFLGQTILAIPLLVLLVLFARGFDVKGKSQSLIDAYQNRNEQQANLLLNGLYTAVNGAIRSKNASFYHFFSDEEVVALTQQSNDEIYSYPFVQSFPENTPNKRNLVVILLESLSYQYVDSLAGTDYGVTPFLDRLTEKAEVYNNFYAAGQRSYYGIQASLFGLPPIHGVGYIGGGLELSRLTRLADIARGHGYQTQMLQSSNRDSIRLDSIADYAGFEQYFGKSDIPVTRTDYPDPDAAKFGWDYEMLMKTFDLANQSQKPFLSFSFTGTTHMPYAETPKAWQVYPYGESEVNNFLNTISYMDKSLELFFDKVKKQPWYNNTTFVILADHTQPNFNIASLDNSFKIPLWIYQPGLNITSVKHQIMSSQLDILPTIFDLLGFSDEFSSTGESLYRKKNGYSIVVKGNLFGAFSRQGSFLSSGNQLIEVNGNDVFKEEVAPEIEQNLKLVFQRSQQAILNNKWAH